jgi:hypothetical protein
MLPAKPMDPVEALTARAASNSGFDPFPATPPPRNDGALLRSMADKTDDPPANENSNWKKFTKWVDERAKAVKKAVSGPPAPQPEPRVGQTRFFEPKKSTSNQPETSKVNVAKPAYGWYGWGSSTPGANPFAPAGDYPNASAQWYAETGATPGAFPVPTMNPYRPAPGSTPPTYVLPTIPPAPAPVAAPRVVPVIPTPKTIAETTATPNVAPPMPPAFLPSNQVPVPPPTSGKPAETMWRPAAATEVMPKPPENQGLIIPVIRGQEPSFDDSPLARKIREACQGLVTNVTIRETGPGQLTIAFQATTATLAEIAARATSNIVELKPYTVDFAAKVNQ